MFFLPLYQNSKQQNKKLQMCEVEATSLGIDDNHYTAV